MSGGQRWKNALGWLATLALAVVLGLVGARYRLLDSTVAVAILGIVVTALIVVGLRLGARLWDDEDE